MNEEILIRALQRIHGGRPYETDAELAPSGDGRLLVSSDSFSLEEDFLAGLDPAAMGRMMAYGACTDLLACGARPEAMTQVWTCSPAEPVSFYESVASGIQDVLAHYGMTLLGGDVATATEWSWSATVLGHSRHPVRRIASSRADFDLYASDHLGAANAAVALGRPLPAPVWREPVSPEALFATDTSGGFFDALENFRRVNPGLWMDVDCDRAVSPELVAGLPSGVDPGWTLAGGVGEYALLFAVPTGTAVREGILVGHGGFRSETETPEIRLNMHGRRGRMKASPPDWRSVAAKDRLEAVARYWQELFA